MDGLGVDKHVASAKEGGGCGRGREIVGEAGGARKASTMKSCWQVGGGGGGRGVRGRVDGGWRVVHDVRRTLCSDYGGREAIWAARGFDGDHDEGRRSK